MLTVIPISNPSITADDVLRHNPSWNKRKIQAAFAGRKFVSMLDILRSDSLKNEEKIWCCCVLTPPLEAMALACLWVRKTPLNNGRTVWDLLTDPRSRVAVETAERYCQGEATDQELEDAREMAKVAAGVASGVAVEAAWEATWAAEEAVLSAAGAAWEEAGEAAVTSQVQLAINAIEESLGA